MLALWHRTTATLIPPGILMLGIYADAMRRALQLKAALSAANAKAPGPARGRAGGDRRLAGALERVGELESENRELREQAARRAQVCRASPLLSCRVLDGNARHMHKMYAES